MRKVLFAVFLMFLCSGYCTSADGDLIQQLISREMLTNGCPFLQGFC